MSWEEIKKGVNSDLNVPLNHLIWLNDYKTYGENSYVFNEKDILHELYNSYRISMNDMTIRSEAMQYISDQNKKVGSALKAIYGLEVDMKGAETWEEIAGDQSIYKSIIANNDVMKFLRSLPSVYNAFMSTDGVVVYAAALKAGLDTEAITTFDQLLLQDDAVQVLLSSSDGLNTFMSSDFALYQMAKSNDYSLALDSVLNSYRSNIVAALDISGRFTKSAETQDLSDSNKSPVDVGTDTIIVPYNYRKTGGDRAGELRIHSGVNSSRIVEDHWSDSLYYNGGALTTGVSPRGMYVTKGNSTYYHGALDWYKYTAN